MIPPTIGRVILYNDGSAQRVPALICCVHSDQCINIGGFDENGNPFAKQSVTLVQDDEMCGIGQAEWMPYQKMKAAEDEVISEPEPPILSETAGTEPELETETDSEVDETENETTG